MPGWIEDRRVKIRRARRADLPAIGALVGREIPTRFGRRAVADRRDEVYVADERGVGVVGAIGLAYRRSLTAGGVVVDVDPLAATRPAIVEGLLAFAAARAEGRGCVRLALGAGIAAPAATAEPPWTGATVRHRPLGRSG